MDVQSPEHLERLRAQPEIKAALLREWVDPSASEARFERAAKNSAYWPPIEELAARTLAAGCGEESQTTIDVYGRPCALLVTVLVPVPKSAYTISIVAADGAPLDELIALIRDVTHDYWHGSYFFK